MKLETLNDLALTVAAARHDLGRLLDALPIPRATTGETVVNERIDCLLYTSPSPRDGLLSRMPSSA